MVLFEVLFFHLKFFSCPIPGLSVLIKGGPDLFSRLQRDIILNVEIVVSDQDPHSASLYKSIATVQVHPTIIPS